MTDTKQTKTAKKTYTRPQVTEVRMAAGEAVLATCKIGPTGLSACVPPDTRCGSASPAS